MEKLGQLVGFLRKPRQGVKASSRSLEQRVHKRGQKVVKGCKICTCMHVDLVLCIPAGTAGMHQAWRVQRVQTGQKMWSSAKIKCRSALFSAGRQNRLPIDDFKVKKRPVAMQIEAPEVSFPMAQTLHQNSSYAKSYALFGEAAQTRSNRDDAQLQPIISPPPGLGSRRFLSAK